MGSLRLLIVPLVAALSAALFAHVAIDVAGDYLLPHDTYDDIAHGSRTLVLGGVAAMLVLLASIALSAAIREARGSIDAFRKVVLSCLDLELRWMFVLTAICATITLIAMEGIDVHAAGGAIDDPGDLFGGSIILGAACVAFFAVLSTFGIRALACAIAGAGRALVRALASVFATRSRPRIVKRRPHEASVCALQPSRRFGTALSGRAPPPALRFRPLF